MQTTYNIQTAYGKVAADCEALAESQIVGLLADFIRRDMPILNYGYLRSMINEILSAPIMPLLESHGGVYYLPASVMRKIIDQAAAIAKELRHGK